MRHLLIMICALICVGCGSSPSSKSGSPAPDNSAPSAVLTFMIAGQSNASGRGILTGKETAHPSVWMFGNDYVWKTAFEPVDDSKHQVDSVGDDLWSTASTYGHGFALRAGKDIAIPLGSRVNLIPCAKGSTQISQWMPSVNRYDRSTLFGSANYRRLIAAPAGLTAIWYYGHESNAGGKRGTYVTDWTAMVAAFRADFGNVPFVFCQLAKHTDPVVNNQQHLTAELQRQTETGSGYPSSISSHYMVVSFDLPLGDEVHLNQTAQKELGRRIALATRQHVLGEDINGTGPRLVSLSHPAGDKARVKVTFTREIAETGSGFDGQFRAYDNGIEKTIISAAIDNEDAASIILTLQSAASGPVTVSYGDVVADGLGMTYRDVVKDSDGLPAPQFGAVAVQRAATK